LIENDSRGIEVEMLDIGKRQYSGETESKIGYDNRGFASPLSAYAGAWAAVVGPG
jgi:hypothetical protein